MKRIRVSDFTTLPGARYRDDGDYSADQFFEEFLEKEIENALKSSETIVIDLDNNLGYASSFVSQLAVRIKGLVQDRKKIKRIIKIESNDDPLQKEEFWNEITG